MPDRADAAYPADDRAFSRDIHRIRWFVGTREAGEVALAVGRPDEGATLQVRIVGTHDLAAHDLPVLQPARHHAEFVATAAELVILELEADHIVVRQPLPPVDRGQPRASRKIGLA